MTSARPNRRLFRPEALGHRGQTEDLDRLLRVSSPHEWVILIGLALLLAGVAAWGLFGTVERTLSAACVLALPGERRAVVADGPGEVIDVLVGTGDWVEAGQPIAHIRMPELRRQAALAGARVSALEEAGDTAPSELAVARADAQALEALQRSSEIIASPSAGQLLRLAVAPGQAVAAGSQVADVLVDGAGRLEAFALLAPNRARRLAAGMDATVRVTSIDRALDATVLEVSPGAIAPSGWLLASGLEAPPRGHLVRLSLDSAMPPAVADGEGCHARIVLRRMPPVRLLTSPGSD